MYALQGRADEAERLARETLSYWRGLGGQVLAANALLGRTLTWIGEYAEAGSLLVEVAASLATERPSLLAQARIHLGRAKMHLGEYEGARAQAQMALRLAQELAWPHEAAFARLVLGRLSLALGAYAEAQELIQDSVAALQEVGWYHELREALASLGYAARGMGASDEARRCLHECLQLGRKKGATLPILHALPAAALLLADRGETERAVELYALASRHPVVANSRWFEDVAGRHIAAVAAALPSDAVAAAQERGRARDLEATVVELLTELGGCCSENPG
jgi:tetratricopeptide (TPR) repeat protein